MTPQDREDFRALTLRQTQLEEALAQLRTEFKEFEQRAESFQVPTELIAGMPPLPVITGETMRVVPPPFPTALLAKEQVVSEVHEAPALPGYLTSFASTSEPVPSEIPPVFETTPANIEQGAEASTAVFPGNPHSTN